MHGFFVDRAWHATCSNGRDMKLGLAPLTAIVAIVLGAFPLACSSSSTESATRPPAVEEAPAETTPAETCADGTYRTLEGTCARFPTVAIARSAVAITPARDHHTTLVRETADGPYLYVFGGTDAWKTNHDDIQRAKIAPDGTLGAFEVVGRLPAGRAGHCMVDLGDRVFLGGGILGRAPSVTTLLVPLGPDGKVGEAVAGPNLPLPVLHLTCDRQGDFLYAVGGRGKDNRSTRMSARLHIVPGGVDGAFMPQTELTPDRSHHASFVRGRRLYVVGGLTGSAMGDYDEHADVISAPIDDAGSLGAWEPAGKLPAGLSVSSALLRDDAVYVVGGLETGGFTTTVRRATFGADGTLTPFVTSNASLPDARGHVHQLPQWGSFFYSVGGKNDREESLSTVDIGRFE